MRSNDIWYDPEFQQRLLDEECLRDRSRSPGSTLYAFKQELLAKGIQFQALAQTLNLGPEYKEQILPSAIKYYRLAMEKGEKMELLKWFGHKGYDEVVPMLLEDFHRGSPLVERWLIADTLYQIRCRAYIREYLGIIDNDSYGVDRQLLILLVGEWRVEEAIPILIRLSDDKDLALHVLSALGRYRREEFRPIFEKYLLSENRVVRRNAQKALENLGKVRSIEKLCEIEGKKR